MNRSTAAHPDRIGLRGILAAGHSADNLRNLIGVDRPIAANPRAEFLQDGCRLDDRIFLPLHQDSAFARRDTRGNRFANLLEMLVLCTQKQDKAFGIADRDGCFNHAVSRLLAGHRRRLSLPLSLVAHPCADSLLSTVKLWTVLIMPESHGGVSSETVISQQFREQNRLLQLYLIVPV